MREAFRRPSSTGPGVLGGPHDEGLGLDGAQVVALDHVALADLGVLQRHVHLVRLKPVGLLEDGLTGAMRSS